MSDITTRIPMKIFPIISISNSNNANIQKIKITIDRVIATAFVFMLYLINNPCDQLFLHSS